MNKVTKKNMLQAMLTMFIALASMSAFAQQTPYFSEAIEGSSNNKALEIYNPTADTVWLDGYAFPNVSNEPAVVGEYDFWNNFPEGSYIAPGEFFVIAHPSAIPEILDKADMEFQFLSNGDDGFALVEGDSAAGSSFTVIDRIGDWQGDPGAGWDVAGVTEATKDHTLLRKRSVTTGNADWTASAGTTAEDSEWIVMDQNFSSNLGYQTGAVNVTFNVNTATLTDTLTEDGVIQIRGGLVGSDASGTGLGSMVTWDSGSIVTTNDGGDYWTIDFKMSAGDTLNYKFWAGRDVDTPLKNGGEDGWESGDNNQFILPADMVADTLVPLQWFETRMAPAAFVSKQPDSIAVWFRVNVGLLVQEGKFDPATDSIEVRGGQLPLTWDSGTGVKLSVEPGGAGDNVFVSGVGYFNQDSLNTYMPDDSPARTIKYKFYATGPNAQVDWESTPDRFATITSTEDTTLHYKFFNDAPPTQEKIVDTKLNFGVNVGILEGLGYFNSGLGDSVKVRGFFNSWGQQPMAFNAFAKIWEAKGIDFSSAVGAEGTYKYYIDWDDSRFDDSSPNYIAAIDDPNDTNRDVGYEEPGITGGGNRVFVLEDAPEQVQQEHFFNSMEPEARMDETNVDGGAISVTFTVDMNPAEQRTSSPFNPATDSVYIVFETPFFAISQGFVKGGGMFSSANTAADIEDRRLTDTDGDGVYEVTIDLQLPTLNHFGFYVAYGRPFAADGTIIDNSEGFDAGRRYYQYVQPQVDANLNVTWPSTATLPTLDWKDDKLPFELPPDYSTVSNEEEIGTVETFRLEQNYPNPFNPTTNIRFSLPNAADVTLTVYNVLGQKVATLLNNSKFTQGSHDIAFDARNLASGVYIYRIEAGAFSQSRKMMLIK